MDVIWIILIGVLLVAGLAGWLIIHLYERRGIARQAVDAAKAARAYDQAIEDAKGKRPNIPVWRDRPQPPKANSNE